MRPNAISTRRVVLLLLLLASLLPIWRIARGGLWEPWELNRAEAARRVAQGEAELYAVPDIADEGERPPLATWVTAAGFAIGGSEVGMGKAAVTLFLIACVAASLLLLWPLLRPETALLAGIVFFSTPLVFFQGGSAGGDGVAYGAYAVAFAGLARLLEPRTPATSTDLALGGAAAAIGLVLSYFALGGVLGVALPLAASSLAVLAGGGLSFGARSSGVNGGRGRIVAALRWVAIGAAVALAVWFVLAVLGHKPDERFERFALAVGGTKAILPLETFDTLLSRLAYSLFPWCALLPIALAWIALPWLRGPDVPESDGAEAPDPLAPHAALHILLAYPILAYWGWRYHAAPVVLVFPMALLVGRYVAATATAPSRLLRPAAIVTALLLAVVVRDVYAFPRDFLAVIGFPGAGDMMTEAPRFSILVAVSTGLMGVILIVTHFIPDVRVAEPWAGRFREQYARFVAALRVLSGRSRRSGDPAPASAIGTIAIYATAVVLWLGLLVVLVVAKETGFGRVTLTHAGTWVVGAALVGEPLVAMVLAVRWRSVLSELRGIVAPLLGAPVAAGGLVVGLAVGLDVAPVLDKGYSLGPAAEEAERHGDIEERLALYQVQAAATNYYRSLAGAKTVATVDEAARWLAAGTAESPRYLVLPSQITVLNDVNQRFRDLRAGMLLPVLSDPGARYLLAASDLPEGRENRSPLARVILSSPVRPMYPILEGSFEDRVEYLGYDIDSYEDGTVAALQNVTITHYWRCTGRVAGDYKIFVHIDGMGDRINGDHDPAGGIYATRYWRPGDIIADSHQVRIPFFVRPARDPLAYRMYVGLFRGESRMSLVRGEGDDNRLWGGVIRVR